MIEAVKMLLTTNSSNYIVFVPGVQKGVGKQFSDEFEVGLYNKKNVCTYALTLLNILYTWKDSLG